MPIADRKNLKELEADFVKGLASYSYTPSSSQPIRKELKKLAGDYYVKTGDTYYIEEINGNLYFEEKNRVLHPVFSMDHPAESVFNLFLSEDTPLQCFYQSDRTPIWAEKRTDGTSRPLLDILYA